MAVWTTPAGPTGSRRLRLARLPGAAIALWGLCLAAATENLIPDSSFEQGRTCRGTYALVGEYSEPEAPAGLALDPHERAAGQRSLRLAPGAVWTCEVVDRYAAEGVFSASIKDAQAVVVQVGAWSLDPHGLGPNAGPATTVREAPAAAGWQRLAVPFANDHKIGANDPCLYSLCVSNRGDGPVWLDAAQLELGRREASPYSPLTCSFYNVDTAAGYELDTRLDMVSPVPAQKASGEVRFRVCEREGQARPGQPVWGGIPFPPGELFDAAALTLWDAAGRPVPCQTAPLARRARDGSIVSLLLHFQVTLAAGEQQHFSLRYGLPAAPPGPGGLARQEASDIVLDTGVLQATLRGNRFRLFDLVRDLQGREVRGEAVNAGAFVHTPDGKQFDSAGTAPDSLTIEENGPLSASIRVTGRHAAADGAGLLAYECHIRAFKGKAYFLIDYTVENREAPRHVLVSDAGLRLPVLAGEGPIRFGLVGEAPISVPTAEGPVALVQTRQRYGPLRYDVLGNGSWRPDRRSDGTLTLPQGGIAVADFWRLNPKELVAGAQGLTVYQWPAQGVKALLWPYGMATTLRLAYAPLGPLADGQALAQQPLTIEPEPAWLAASGLFGHFLDAPTAAREYPRFSAVEEQVFAMSKRWLDVSAYDGMFDYGDLGNPAFASNHETEAVRNLWVRYARTLDPELYRWACAASLHARDVDVTHIRPGVAMRSVHGSGTHASYNFHTGHYWMTGVVWHYLFTGDRRSLDVATAAAAELVRKSGLRYQGRERARLLMHLAEIYELTGIRSFREAMERQYAFNQWEPMTPGYYSGLALIAYRQMYQATGERRYLERFLADGEDMVKICRQAPTPDAVASVGEGRSWYLFRALGELAASTGDRKFADAAAGALPKYTAAMTAQDSCMAMAAPYLWALHRFGIPESGQMPNALTGLGRLCGAPGHGDRSTAFTLEIPVGAGSAELQLYRLRRFRFASSSKAPDWVEYQLTSPHGDSSQTGRLEGEAEFAMKTLLLPPATGEPWRLQVNFIEDSWGAVACSVPVRLSADHAYFARHTRFVPLAWWVQAPRSGRLALDYRWDFHHNGYAGQTLGAALEDGAGRLVDCQVWTVPRDYPPAAGSGICTWRQVLSIPPALRGHPLRLIVNDSKWVEWQVEGLDYPWLASAPAALPGP